MKATGLFWRRGYQATSIPDLLDAMEIGRSSLYAAFGDKRALFLECLDVYVGRTLALLADARAQAVAACLRDAGCDQAQAAELAGFLMLVNQGLRVSSRLNLPLADRQAQLDTTFRVLAAAIPAAPSDPATGERPS